MISPILERPLLDTPLDLQHQAARNVVKTSRPRNQEQPEGMNPVKGGVKYARSFSKQMTSGVFAAVTGYGPNLETGSIRRD